MTFGGLPDGSAPPSPPWVVPGGTTGTSVTVQAGALRFVSGSQAGAFHGGRAYMSSPAGLTDFDRVATLSVESPTVVQYTNFNLRMDSFWAHNDYATNGYRVSLRLHSASEKIIVGKMSGGGSVVQKAGANFAWSAGQQVRVWTSVVGAGPVTIKAWVWPVGGAEPSAATTPTIQWTDTEGGYIASGMWGFGMASDLASRAVTLDDISFAAPTGTPPPAGSGVTVDGVPVTVDSAAVTVT